MTWVFKTLSKEGKEIEVKKTHPSHIYFLVFSELVLQASTLRLARKKSLEKGAMLNDTWMLDFQPKGDTRHMNSFFLMFIVLC